MSAQPALVVAGRGPYGLHVDSMSPIGIIRAADGRELGPVSHTKLREAGYCPVISQQGSVYHPQTSAGYISYSPRVSSLPAPEETVASVMDDSHFVPVNAIPHVDASVPYHQAQRLASDAGKGSL